MECIYGSSPEQVKNALIQDMAEKLKLNMPVLFLASGGSTAGLAADVCNGLAAGFPKDDSRLKWLLTVTLADERWGAAGHSESNWKLLLEKGLPVHRIGTVPLLKDDTDTGAAGMEDAVRAFEKLLGEAVERRERGELHIAGLFGIGEDGHTAGILPGSPASLCAEKNRQDGPWAAGYSSALFKRITITPAFLSHVDLALAWAGGASKMRALAAIHSSDSFEDVPAKYLQTARRSAVYTDQENR